MQRLCHLCRRIFEAPPRLEKLQKHHSTPDEIQKSVLDGCFICGVIWRSFYEGQKLEYMISKASIAPNARAYPGLLQLVFRVKTGSSYTLHLEPLKAIYSLDVERKLCSSEAGCSALAHSSFNLGHAARWLKLCLDQHQECRQVLVSEKQYPTRLVEIDKPIPGHVRLVQDTTILPRDLQYTTLSHCWGQTQGLRLTSETESSLQHGIPASSLPRTFGDAVMVARKLQIPFIWVDSLCILQDSKKDWQNEAPRMAQVYGGALLNIAAASAANTDAGFLPRTQRPLLEPLIVEIQETEYCQGQYFVCDGQYQTKAFADLPLTSRAWVVQESLMSARVLHFCQDEMFWECSGLNACEAYLCGLPRILGRPWVAKDTFRSVLQKLPGSESEANLEGNGSKGASLLWKSWREIIETYTACRLTYPTDKLVAISAIAKLIRSALDVGYCAGLWKYQIGHQLLWRSIGDSVGPRCSPMIYRAPSWSWASLDGRVSFGRFQENDDRWKSAVTILDCQVVTSTDDDTGEIIGGALSVSGFLATMRLKASKVVTGKGAGMDEWTIFANDQWIAEGLPPGVYFDGKVEAEEIWVHALLVLVDTRDDQPGLLVFLLLQSSGGKRGHFRRIGVLYGSFGSLGIKGKDFGALRGVRNESWMECISSDDDGTCTIEMI